MSTIIATRRPAASRAPWRVVVLPGEHGGWALTAEPALLGLLIAPSEPGVALALAGVVAFLARTPVKLVLVDAFRRRWLPRTQLAACVAATEMVVLGALIVVAGSWSGWSWLLAPAVAAPLVAVELWFDMRSRSRRLVPELCGAVGIAGLVAAIVVAGGQSVSLAVGAWLLLGARSLAAIPLVRAQIRRLHHRPFAMRPLLGMQVIAIAIAVGAVVVEPRLTLGAVGVAAAIALGIQSLGRAPQPAKVLGLTQLGAGLGVVALAAVGVWAA